MNGLMTPLSVFNIFLVIFFSSGQIELLPHERRLPDAKVAKLYSQEVKLFFAGSGAIFFLNDNNSRVTITPDDSGLNVQPNFDGCHLINEEKRCSGFGKVVITGVPLVRGEVRVDIVGRTYSSMFNKTHVFHREYIINIE